ncbi:hypothetical protein PR003_g4076 [Phytophthora rubi]|uniref:Malic enzyme NAD-binding domain-containing protein n=1 Tax=Phytophthora rubi TaxID=129364 RepID=A0A6A4G5P0_9STRA|nr:hypothetical protein PR003_g4076 [Phytophthora rubi]
MFDQLVDEFMNLAKAKYGGEVLLQFEDRRPSTCCASHCTFNDDIQGTASVVLGGLLAAVPLSSTPISEQKLVFLGAGTAGIPDAGCECSTRIKSLDKGPGAPRLYRERDVQFDAE